jgi:hypothetical protein
MGSTVVVALPLVAVTTSPGSKLGWPASTATPNFLRYRPSRWPSLVPRQIAHGHGNGGARVGRR